MFALSYVITTVVLILEGVYVGLWRPQLVAIYFSSLLVICVVSYCWVWVTLAHASRSNPREEPIDAL